ncbi:hypothetical protein, partial [Streptomyces sp. Vc17.3-30]|uniref:hypothetical protein n=1 Tax=Streptomyces sp. Vc17.3-30 TaxID=2841672 RepID=UPI0020963A57
MGHRVGAAQFPLADHLLKHPPWLRAQRLDLPQPLLECRPCGFTHHLADSRAPDQLVHVRARRFSGSP